jgi:hypothetical protein
MAKRYGTDPAESRNVGRSLGTVLDGDGHPFLFRPNSKSAEDTVGDDVDRFNGSSASWDGREHGANSGGLGQSLAGRSAPSPFIPRPLSVGDVDGSHRGGISALRQSRR